MLKKNPEAEKGKESRQNLNYNNMKALNVFLKINFKVILVTAGLILSAAFYSCEKEEEDDPADDPALNLVGREGNPRFNLVFTNHQNVDLDLYVKAPNGTIVSYQNRVAAGGTLDVDCLCSSCPTGPNENIYWQAGLAPTGTYQYWVKYFGTCSGAGTTTQISDFTIKVTRNGTVLATQSGRLSSGQSSTFTHNQ